MNLRSHFLLLCLVCMLHMSCTGNDCSATLGSTEDQDSDCVDDASDNCVGFYNPDQFDGDEDTIGYACDADDEDDAVALVRSDSVPEESADDE